MTTAAPRLVFISSATPDEVVKLANNEIVRHNARPLGGVIAYNVPRAEIELDPSATPSQEFGITLAYEVA